MLLLETIDGAPSISYHSNGGGIDYGNTVIYSHTPFIVRVCVKQSPINKNIYFAKPFPYKCIKRR